MLRFVAVIFALMAYANCQKTISTENAYVDISTKGEITASKNMNITADKNKLSASISAIKQILNDNSTVVEDISGLTVTLTGPTNNTDTPPSTRVIGTGTVRDGTLTLIIDVFTAAGNVTVEDQKTVVAKGDVMVTVKMENYNFTTNATNLELTLTISGSGTPSKNADDKTTDGDSYALGGNGTLKLFTKAMEGANTYVPVTPTNNGKNFMIKLSTNALLEYKAVMVLAGVDTSTGTGGEPSSSSRIASLGVLVWFLMVAQRFLY